MSEKKAKEPTPEEKVALRSSNVQTLLLKNIGKVNAAYRGKSHSNIISYDGTPSALVSNLSNPKEASTFLAGTSAALSLLTPTLTFWWVKGTEKHEFLFSDHVSGDKMVSLAEKKVDESFVLKSRDTIGTDVGVQEFTWMFDNKHSGDKTLKASVTIYFGSVRELLNEKYLRFIFTQNSIEEKVNQRPPDPGDKNKATRELEKRFAAMKSMNSPDEVIRAMKAETKDYTQIKVDVGWALPDKDLSPVQAESDAMKKAIESTQKTIMLNFTKYDLTFGEQGQVKLKIEYVGSLDAVMIDDEKADVFAGRLTKGNNVDAGGMTLVPKAINFEAGTVWGSSPKDKLIDIAYKGGLLERHIKAGKEEDPRSKTEAFRFCLPMVRYERETLQLQKQFHKVHGSKSKKQEQMNAKLDQGLEAIDIAESMLLAKLAREKHKLFLNTLYFSSKIRKAEAQNRVYSADDPPDGPAPIDVKIQGGTTGANASVRNGWSQAAELEATHASREASGQNEVGIVTRAAGVVGSGVLAVTEWAGITDPTPKHDPQSNPGQARTAGYVPIYYFSVGDLIDIAVSTNTFLKSKELDARIILGNFNAASAGITDVPGTIPIANVPLNVEWFSQWFTENFVTADPPRYQMSLREFINKVLETLVAPLMSDAFSTQQKTARISFSMTTMTCPKSGAGLLRRGSSIGDSDIAAAAEAARAAASKALNPEVHYFIVFATISDPKSLRGDYAADLKRGIFHLFLGSERGLVKKFNFKEKKMPHIRAMHIENNSPGSALILPQDVELTMVGNTFFRNGSLVYIDADFALGQSVASKLGIGGYYLVVKSENVINSSKFETVLTCMFQQSPSTA